jgi:DNA polymerase IV
LTLAKCSHYVLSMEASIFEKPWHDGAELNWLYLDMNSYFASCEQQDKPFMRGKPVIVVPVMSDHTSAIAASYQAKALGIKTGTKVSDAKALCPGIFIVEARPDRYVDLHHKIIEQVDRVLPIDRVCSIDEVACRLMGPQRLEVAARALGHRIQRYILEHVGQCLTASIGLAPSKLLAKTAADMKKPLGLTVLRQDTLPGALLTLRPDDIAGIGPRMAQRLNAAGIDTVADLWGLSASQMRKIWGGIVGENLWYALHGIDPPEIETIRSSISHSHVLGGPLRPLALARPVARRLMAKCGSRLRRMGYKCRHVYLSIRGDPVGRAAADMRLAATSDSFKMLQALDLMWDDCVLRLGARKVKKISVVCSELILAEQAPDLFGWTPEKDENPRHMRLLKAVDGLNQRYGKDAITIGPHTAIHGFVGAKIAFNRIPEGQEFRE